MIRRQHPVLNQQQIPDIPPQSKRVKERIKKEIKKKLGIEVKPVNNYKDNPKAQYTNFTPEAKEIQKQAVMDSVAYRKARDKTFKRKLIRESHISITKDRGLFRTCSMCGETKGRGAFDKRMEKDKKFFRYRSYCYLCRRKKNQEYYQKNKEKWEHINDHRRIHK